MSSPFDLTDDTLRALYNQCGKSVRVAVARVKDLYEASGGANVMRTGTHVLPVDDPYPPSMVNADFVGGLAMPILMHIAKEQESDEEDSPIIGHKKPKARVGSDEEDSPIIGRKKREPNNRARRESKKPNRFAPSVDRNEIEDDYSDEDSPVKSKPRKHAKRRLRKGSDFVDDAAECDEDGDEEEDADTPGSMRDFITSDHESTPSASTPGSARTPGSCGSVKVTGEKTREERDAEGRANAINLVSPDHA